MTHQSQNPLTAYFQSRPVAIERTRLPELLEQSRQQAARVAAMTPAQVEAAVVAASETPIGRMVGAVAVLPIKGVITQKADFYSWFFGGTSVERLVAAFRHYLNDPAVSAIVFDVDSPGGEVYGLQEGFRELLAGRGQKKTFAIVNPFMASAAYFLGCAAERIWMTESGQVGSIGCYTMHYDMSEMLKAAGVNVTFVQYGEHKTDGNSYEPLSEVAHADLQAMVNYYGTEFDKAVAEGRDVSMADVKKKFGQGRMFQSKDAKQFGLVDKIGTRDELLLSLAPPRNRGLSASAGAGTEGETHVEEAALVAQREQDADAAAVALTLTELG